MLAFFSKIKEKFFSKEKNIESKFEQEAMENKKIETVNELITEIVRLNSKVSRDNFAIHRCGAIYTTLSVNEFRTLYMPDGFEVRGNSIKCNFNRHWIIQIRVAVC